MCNFRFILPLILLFVSSVGSAGARWLVRVEDSGTRAKMEAAHYRLVHQYKHFPWAVYEAAPVAAGKARMSLQALGVRHEPIVTVHLVESITPDDPRYNKDQTAFHPLAADADIHLPEAWGILHDAPEVVVAVIDSGIDPTHQDLVNNLWTNPAEASGQPLVDDDVNSHTDDLHGWNTVDNSSDITDSVPTDSGTYHGTAVAGVIGAEGNNGLGIAGVCWKTRLMVVRAFAGEETDMSYILAAIDYAVSFPAVRVINASWGGSDGSQALHDAIAAAGAKGIVFVTAAGNDGFNLETHSFYPASYAADLDNVISVAAIGNLGTLADFSNYGPGVTVAAPGVSILFTQPGDQYAAGSGTSFAAPIVSGAVALLLTQRPGLTPVQVRDWLIQTSRRTTSLSSMPLLGGLLNVQALLTQPSAARNWLLYR